ncbi:MAG: TGS domain-containing protein [Deltaproteobacteria bacterium]|nr:TGS domain-containing protein [Deltaproteobacteria bacterium]
MPANLPPQYFEAEKRYREATTPQEKVEALEEMLMIMPKHKGTDKLRADLRRRISKVKTQAQQKKGPAKRDAVYSVEREGATQVILVGPPNTGKSSLVAALTNASPEIADFPHSTWKPVPGMVQYENIQFQMVDTPPLSKEHNEPWLADLIRRGDLLAIMLDLHADPIGQLEDTLKILEGLRIFPEGRSIPDGLKKPPFIKKFLVLVNKMDREEDREDFEVFLELAETDLPCLGISSRTKFNLDVLLKKIYEAAGIIRVYTKAPGKDPDLGSPFVLPRDSTLEVLAGKVHKDFIEKLKYAKIWGKKVYDGQMVQRDYVLQDGDVVEMHI